MLRSFHQPFHLEMLSGVGMATLPHEETWTVFPPIRAGIYLLAEARALATVVHVTPSTLEVLATDPRWSQDEEIRIFIATHPQVPIPLAESRAARLEPPALRRILSRPSLNALLRDKIVKRLPRG